jgi:hypothetical protein
VAEAALQRFMRRLCAGSFAAAAVTSVPCALARHTDEEHITADTAWTLEGDKDWHISLFKAQVTLADRVAIGTYTWPWLAAVPSLQVKWRFLSLGGWHFAGEVGFVRLDTSNFGENDAVQPPVFSVTTGTLSQTLELNASHQLSNNLVVTGVRAEGSVTSDTLRGAGEGAATNLQYVGAYEYRVSRTLAIVVTGRYQLFTVVAARFTSTVEPDEFTTIDLAARGSDDTALDFDYVFSIVPSLNWSWDTFNLRLGLGYGNFNVPGINFMVGDKNDRIVIPELDLFWTF